MQAHHRVGYLELVLHEAGRGLEVEGGEVPVVVRERLGELVGPLAQVGRPCLVAGRVELEELVDASGRGLVEPPVRLREVLEPLELERVRGG